MDERARGVQGWGVSVWVAVAVMVLVGGLLVACHSAESSESDGGLSCRAVKSLFNTAYFYHITRAEDYPQSYPVEDNRKIIVEYMSVLDPEKMYFSQNDVDAVVSDYGKTLFQRIQAEDCFPVHDIYNLWAERVLEAQWAFHRLLGRSYDFSILEYVAVSKVRKFVDEYLIYDRMRKVLKSYIYPVVSAGAVQDDDEEGDEDSTADLEGLELGAAEQQRLRRIFREDVIEAEKRSVYRMRSRFVKAVYSQLGPHTQYLESQEADGYVQLSTSERRGLGLVLAPADEGAEIKLILEDSPADKNDFLREGDLIVAIQQDRRDPAGEDAEAVWVRYDDVSFEYFLSLLHGVLGEPVVLLVQRRGEGPQGVLEQEVELVRESFVAYEDYAPYHYHDVESDLGLEGVSVRTGYIYIPSFANSREAKDDHDLTEGTAYAVGQAAHDLIHKHGVDVLILDLRNNGGGLTDQSRYMVQQFVNPEVTSFLQAAPRKGAALEIVREELIRKKGSWEVFLQTPTLVLVNRGSASAAEMFAQALQVSHRALIVGDPATYGKGLQQHFSVYRSGNTSFGVKVTTGKFYGLDGTSLHNRGVPADIIVPSRTAGRSDYSHRYRYEHYENNVVPEDLPEEYRLNMDLGFTDPDMIRYLQQRSTDRTSVHPRLKKSWRLYRTNLSYYDDRMSRRHDPLWLQVPSGDEQEQEQKQKRSAEESLWDYERALYDEWRQERQWQWLKLRLQSRLDKGEHMRKLFAEDEVLAETLQIAADYFVLCKWRGVVPRDERGEAFDDYEGASYEKEKDGYEAFRKALIYMQQGCQAFQEP